MLLQNDNLENIIVDLINDSQTFIAILKGCSHASPVFEALEKNQSKISQIILHTRGFQTTPLCLAAFKSHEKILMVRNPNLHLNDNCFLFMDENDEWIMLITSANLGKNQAHIKQMNLSSLMDSEELSDDEKDAHLAIFLALIKDLLGYAQVIDEESLQKYTDSYNTHKINESQHHLESVTKTLIQKTHQTLKKTNNKSSK